MFLPDNMVTLSGKTKKLERKERERYPQKYFSLLNNRSKFCATLINLGQGFLQL